MKMLRTTRSCTHRITTREEDENRGGVGIGVVVVGVKLDQQSRELLTWALVKVAQPGDHVIALHVLNANDVVDRDGKSSLLSLVKAFDSILAVYEGFCNLKQVDLKLKICRGDSIKKILVREARAYVASKVIVGTARNHLGSIRSSTSVAKYCGRKLSGECCVVAINNGKVVFQRETNGVKNIGSRGADDHHWQPKNLLHVISRTLSKNSRLSSSGVKLLKSGPNCSVYAPDSVLSKTHCAKSGNESSWNGGEDNSLALVPLRNEEGVSSSSSILIRNSSELRPGWPLLRQAFLPLQTVEKSSFKKISVVQWALQLPSRCSSSALVHPDQKRIICNFPSPKLDGESGAIVPVGITTTSPPSSPKLDEESGAIVSIRITTTSPPSSPKLDGKTGAIVPVGITTTSPPSSPEHGLKRLPEELEHLHEKYSSSCRLFSYQELMSATSNFMPDNLIGKGGCSRVYRGCLPDGKELAVKILKPSEDMVEEFVLEIEITTSLHHNNIISLIGFCFENNNLMLVYDLLSRGSLEENLQGKKNNDLSFSWGERFKVALGVAEALDYLHSGNAQPVIHRDIKSSNILLSDDFEPQLSDFGLAQWASASSSHITCSDVAGTFGYLAPEYFMYGKVNEKIDVYAFGVVLLELLSGRKPISNEYPKGQESLVMWARPILNGGKAVQLLDPILASNCDNDQMERMVLAASMCIRRAPRSRPRMNLVLKLLQGDLEVTKWAKQHISASEEFDDESFPPPNIQSHLNLALLDIEDDSVSISSVDQSVSLEDYLQGRWSRSSSFD
ncbi:hypothetical protein GIB67_029762 [Kingdonia uniflora]|uniref:Protein kinase domain-containing protein n=1 Tax=Kingdonia uniflora TaxID=39325 RepID=A0A7J7NJH4_9MAGN|nr:hypothetical protein GIB67_029762 [Kingdonia uniflora]